MSRTWTDGSGLALDAANLNAMETDITTGMSTGSVYFSAKRISTTQTYLTHQTFATFPLDTVIENTGGGTWDSTNYLYTVPKSGLYMCLAGMRATDSAGTTSPNFSMGIGIHTSNIDGWWVHWADSGSTMRPGRQYTRVARFNSGDHLRLYAYYDAGSDFPIGPGDGGNFMSITLIST